MIFMALKHRSEHDDEPLDVGVFFSYPNMIWLLRVRYRDDLTWPPKYSWITSKHTTHLYKTHTYTNILGWYASPSDHHSPYLWLPGWLPGSNNSGSSVCQRIGNFFKFKRMQAIVMSDLTVRNHQSNKNHNSLSPDFGWWSPPHCSSFSTANLWGLP